MQTQQLTGYIAAQAPPDARAAFIRRTYQHLAMAILAFMGVLPGRSMPGSLPRAMRAANAESHITAAV